MKRASLFLFAVALLAASSGCCCGERLFCWGCRGNCAYGHEGPGCDSCGSCGGGGCGGGGCSDCGFAGNTVTRGGYAGGGPMRGGPGGPGGPGYGPGGPGGPGYGPGGPGGPMMAQRGVNGVPRHPAQGHPFAHQRRDADGEYEFAAGPPSGGVTYPYYTHRGPRDFLARNPRSIGP